MNLRKQETVALVLLVFLIFFYALENNITKNVIRDIEMLGCVSQIVSPKSSTKILIVPGHDRENPGARYEDIEEVELNLAVAKKLQELLGNNEKFEIFLTQDANGYNPKLARYLKRHQEEIFSFSQQKREEIQRLIDTGDVVKNIRVQHNTARPEVVDVLYGINKFSNDNNFDIILHIHFNDYLGRKGRKGKYRGFSIYVPDNQLQNAESSLMLAEKIKDRLTTYFPESNLELESGALVETQDLIAIGANNTVSATAVLIEYGYIYEDKFNDPELKEIVFDKLAQQTYLGIQDYLDSF